MDATDPTQGQLRDAYLPSRRVRFASVVAGLCAVALLVGLLGSGLTWWGRSELFDLAGNSRQTVKMGLGYLAGPLLILATLPLVLGRARQLALKRYYRARILAAASLWVVGFVLLVAKVSGLDGYDIEAGTYVAGGLLILGLASTLTMWPGNLPVVRVDRNGMVREPATAAAAPPGRFPTGP